MAARPRRGAALGPGERLRRGWEYKNVYDEARSLHGRAFVLFVRRSDGLDRRAGFVAGRKVGHAVRRNRARRLLREAYRVLKSRLPERGVHLVFVAKAACAEQTLSALDREMRDLLSRAGLL